MAEGSTPRFSIPYVPAATASKHVYVNEAFAILDALSGIIPILDRDLSAPAGGEEDGAMYIVSGAGTGLWEGFVANSIALLFDGAWRQILPRIGMIAIVVDEAVTITSNGDIWTDLDRGADGIAGTPYDFDDETDTEADAGAGKVWLDDADPAAATELAIADADSSGVDRLPAIEEWDGSSSAVRGYVQLRKLGVSGAVFFGKITGARADEDGWSRFTFTPLVISGTINAGDPLDVVFFPTGDAGESGIERLAGTSSTELTVGPGTQSLTAETNRVWPIGQRLRLAKADLSLIMEGEVASYDAGTGALEVEVDYGEGSGTNDAWVISIVGSRGPAGTSGDNFDPDEVVDVLADRDAFDDEAKGFSVLVIEQRLLYFKLSGSSGDWSAGVPFGFATEGTFRQGAGTGDGATVAFNLGETIGDIARVLWVEGGVVQRPTTDYTVSGSTLTRTTAPADGVPYYWWLIGNIEGVAGGPGEDGTPGTDPGVFFNWDDSTSVGDPGSGKIAGNHVNLQSVTTLSISKENRAGDSVAAWLARFDDSTSTHKGTLTLTKPNSDAQAIYAVSAISVEADHVEVAVTHDGGATGSAFMEGPISVQFAGTGNKGSDGAGNVSTVNLVAPTDGNIALEAGNIPTSSGGTFEGDDVETVLDALDGRITDAEADISGKADTAALDDYVAEALFDANTILAANSDNTPAAVVVAEQRLVGRLTGGNIAGLDHAGVRSVAKIVVIEETDYDALDPPDADTIYFVIEDA